MLIYLMYRLETINLASIINETTNSFRPAIVENYDLIKIFDLISNPRWYLIMNWTIKESLLCLSCPFLWYPMKSIAGLFLSVLKLQLFITLFLYFLLLSVSAWFLNAGRLTYISFSYSLFLILFLSLLFFL